MKCIVKNDALVNVLHRRSMFERTHRRKRIFGEETVESRLAEVARCFSPKKVSHKIEQRRIALNETIAANDRRWEKYLANARNERYPLGLLPFSPCAGISTRLVELTEPSQDVLSIFSFDQPAASRELGCSYIIYRNS